MYRYNLFLPRMNHQFLPIMHFESLERDKSCKGCIQGCRMNGIDVFRRSYLNQMKKIFRFGIFNCFWRIPFFWFVDLIINVSYQFPYQCTSLPSMPKSLYSNYAPVWFCSLYLIRGAILCLQLGVSFCKKYGKRTV